MAVDAIPHFQGANLLHLLHVPYFPMADRAGSLQELGLRRLLASGEEPLLHAFGRGLRDPTALGKVTDVGLVDELHVVR